MFGYFNFLPKNGFSTFLVCAVNPKSKWCEGGSQAEKETGRMVEQEFKLCRASTAKWPEKNRQISIKVAQNDFTRKMIDFDLFTKIA